MAAAPSLRVELTPGAYLRRRREAADVTLRQLGMLYAYNPLGAPAAEAMLDEAEADLATLGEPAIRRVAEHIPLAVDIYLRLVDGLPPPDLCARCGCSWDDPCDVDGRGCAWANAARNLCTACTRTRA